jgi:hypothetical protein
MRSATAIGTCRPSKRERYGQLGFRLRQLHERRRHEIREGDRREYYELAEQIERMRREQYRMLRF